MSAMRRMNVIGLLAVGALVGTALLLVLHLLGLATSRAAAQTIEPEDDPAFERAGILVVSSHRSYASARRAAQSFSRRSGIAFDTRGLIFDERRGLIWPDGFDDELYAGGYAPRRYDECGDSGRCVSIERSDGYEGFQPGLYIVVAGIVGADAPPARLTSARRYAPDAYVKETTLYMGCMH
jgi:hypothetical protein